MSSFMVVKIKTQLTKLQADCLRCRGSQSLDLERVLYIFKGVFVLGQLLELFLQLLQFLARLLKRVFDPDVLLLLCDQLLLQHGASLPL